MAYIKQPLYMLRDISTKEVTAGAIISEALDIFLFKFCLWGTYFIAL